MFYVLKGVDAMIFQIFISIDMIATVRSAIEKKHERGRLKEEWQIPLTIIH